MRQGPKQHYVRMGTDGLNGTDLARREDGSRLNARSRSSLTIVEMIRSINVNRELDV